MTDLEKGLEAFEKKDYKTAFYNLEPFAKKGHTKSQYLLARMYYMGDGAPQHFSRAHMWANLAASHGHPIEAANLRTEIEKKMTPEQIKEAQDSALVASMVGT